MAVKNREGQIFIVGTLLFTAVIVGIVFLSQTGGISPPGPETPKVLSEKGMDEFPRAVNLGSSNSSAHKVRNRVVSYLDFHDYVVSSRGATASAHTLILVPNSTGVSAIVANFRGEEMENAVVSVDGSEKEFGSIDDGEAYIKSFTEVSPQFQANLSFTADRDFDHSFTASKIRITALYRLEVDSTSQTWKNTEIY